MKAAYFSSRQGLEKFLNILQTHEDSLESSIEDLKKEFNVMQYNKNNDVYVSLRDK